MQSIAELVSLEGSVAIVTGGAKGIGEAISYRLAEAGASVVIADTDQKVAEETAQKLSDKGWKASAVTCDVSKESDVKQMIDFCLSTYGQLDILVNNAGIYPMVPLGLMTLSDFNKVINVNLQGVFLCTKYASEAMKQAGQGGRIINVTSIDALHPSSVGLSHYDASKHGVWGFTKNAALELAEFNIWVNAIAPGGILTPGATANQPDSTGIDQTKVMEAFLKSIPMRKMGEPDDIGKATLFLASNLSSYMTGSQIVVDGGKLLT